MERSGLNRSPFDSSRANQNSHLLHTRLARLTPGGGTPTMNGGFAGRERTERRLIASRFPSPLRLFGVDVNGVRDERGSPSDERGSRGVRDELGSLGVGFGRSNPGLHGSSPRVSPPILHETLRNVQRPEAGSLLGARAPNNTVLKQACFRRVVYCFRRVVYFAVHSKVDYLPKDSKQMLSCV